jgi:hypothetical protein
MMRKPLALQPRNNHGNDHGAVGVLLLLLLLLYKLAVAELAFNALAIGERVLAKAMELALLEVAIVYIAAGCVVHALATHFVVDKRALIAASFGGHKQRFTVFDAVLERAGILVGIAHKVAFVAPSSVLGVAQ